MAQIQSAGTATATTLQPAFASPLVRQTGFAIAGSIFVALCAHISIPLLFTPVPLTMQNFAVLLLGLLMEPATAFVSMTLYLIEGASGLPVFTPHGPGGILQILGPSGGFLLAYPFVAGFASLLSRRIRLLSFTTLAFAGAIASALLYLCGAGWLATIAHLPVSATLKLAVLPFLAGDALKVVAAAALAISFRKIGTRFARNRSVR